MVVKTQCIFAEIFGINKNTTDSFHNTIRVVPSQVHPYTKGPRYHRLPPHHHDQKQVELTSVMSPKVKTELRL
jgi:hypothetical protein